jgi:hypothetical protein
MMGSFHKYTNQTRKKFHEHRPVELAGVRSKFDSPIEAGSTNLQKPDFTGVVARREAGSKMRPRLLQNTRVHHMCTRRLKSTLLPVALMFISPLGRSACAQTVHPPTSQELTLAIAELRSGKHEVEPNANKDDTGAHLAHLIRRAQPNRVDDRTIADVEFLLDSPDDYIRFWAATSLGELGPRAKIAAPKLLELLPVVDCLDGAITAASAIRFALKRIGTRAPRPPLVRAE